MEPQSSTNAGSGTVDRVVGVYHAKGTALGELSYWVKARVRGGHCALCDITHGTFREKPEWRACRDRLDLPVDTVHLDERDADLERFTAGRTPCVVAATANGYNMLIEADGLDACDGSPECLVDSITARIDELGLRTA